MVHFRFPIHQLPHAFQDLASDVETIVDHVLKNKGDGSGESTNGSESFSAFTPPIDIYESEGQFDLFVDLPGVKPEEVTIEMLEDRLVLKGQRAPAVATESPNIHRQERVAGNFLRSIRLPKLLDLDKIEAHYNQGVLHVVLPKQPKPSARTIEIKTAS
jgi:HSP20 family protein